MPNDLMLHMESKTSDPCKLWESHPAVASPSKCCAKVARTEPCSGLGTRQFTPVPDRGVTLQALLRFAATIPQNLTTSEVVKQHIVPATTAAQCPYISVLPPEHIAPPTHLVVHSWAAPFHHLISQLRAHFQASSSSNPYIWLDLFALPHHPATPKTTKELQQETQAVQHVLASTGTLLLSLGPMCEALSDLPCLHTICATIAHNRQRSIRVFTPLPPSLPFLVESLSSINLATAAAPCPQERRTTLDAIVAMAARTGATSPFQTFVDPLVTAASVMNPILQRVLIDRTTHSALEAASPMASSDTRADSLFLQAAMQLAGTWVSPREDTPSAGSSAEHLAAQCLALRLSIRGPQQAGAVAAARHLLAEVLRGHSACNEADLHRALELMQQAAKEWLACGRKHHAARALVGAAEVCNSLDRCQDAEQLSTQALALLATLPYVHPADRAAASAALGHALYSQGNARGAEAALMVAVDFHISSTAVGPHSSRRAAAVLRDYAITLLALRRTIEAEQWARRALAAAEAAYGPEAGASAECMEVLALALLDQHCLAAAAAAPAGPAEHSMEDWQHPPLDSEHSSGSNVMSWSPAVALSPASSLGLPLSLSPSSPASRANSTEACRAEAEQLLRRRLRVMLQQHGKGHPQVVRGSCMLAQALHRTQQYHEAERIYLAVLQSLREATHAGAVEPPPCWTPFQTSGPTLSPTSSGPVAPVPKQHIVASSASNTCTSTSTSSAITQSGPVPAHAPQQQAPTPLQHPSQAIQHPAAQQDPQLQRSSASGKSAAVHPIMGSCTEGQASAEMADAVRADSGRNDAVASGDQDGGTLEGTPCALELSSSCSHMDLGGVLRELASVYEDWGRPGDAEMCRRQASLQQQLFHDL